MPRSSTPFLSRLGIAALVAAGAAACSDGTGTLPPETVSQLTAGASIVASPNYGVADPEYIEICKYYTEGTGPTVTFDVAIDVGNNGSVDNTFQVQLGHGQCADVWVHGGTSYDAASVTEQVPSGYTTTNQVQVDVVTSGVDNRTTGPVTASASSGTMLVRGNTGATVTYTNTLEPPPPPPPPPPPEGQGCTPGYWKQPQHFSSWPAPYTPSTLFSSVFENAFPGKTLVQVASLNGGGLNALGRHTVAALLSSASGGVNYPLSTQEVIDAFNAVYPGGDYEGQKNIFAGYNELGCPLN